LTGISKYCTITDLNMLDPERHLVNLVIDRAGSSIDDYDVVRNLERYISKASTDLEAILRRYTTVPIDPTITSLTGSFIFIRGDTTVNITGGAAISELAVGDEIRPDDQEDIRLIVAEINSDTEITLENVFYYEYDLTGDASKYVPNVPKEVNQLVSDHCSWLVWARRTQAENNPHRDREADYQRALSDIKKGEYRFSTVGGTVVKTIPTLTDTDVERVMIDDNFEDYTSDPDDENYGEWRDLAW